MTTDLADTLVWLLLGYLGAGLAFALPFVAWGAPRIDPAAAELPWSVRLLVVPGSLALWPLMLVRWLQRRPPPVA